MKIYDKICHRSYEIKPDKIDEVISFDNKNFIVKLKNMFAEFAPGKSGRLMVGPKTAEAVSKAIASVSNKNKLVNKNKLEGFSKRNFRDYGTDFDYFRTFSKKIDLALPKKILKNPKVKAEIERLKLTTFQYLNPFLNENEIFTGTFYWNELENAWKYYEREALYDFLDDDRDIISLEKYLVKNDDDYFPHFSQEDDEALEELLDLTVK